MPELPEVEVVRRTLSARVIGARVVSVSVFRSEVVRGDRSDAALLAGDAIASIERKGKQLALVGESGRSVAVHLGMSGQLCVWGEGSVATRGAGAIHGEARPKQIQRVRPGSGSRELLPAHTHVVWQLSGGQRIRFTDPRRFGGLWTYGGLASLEADRWSRLGPDALGVTPGQMRRALSGTRRGLKAVLLDQSRLAGLGNIYVDELLFGARLHPLLPASELSRTAAESLAGRTRRLLSGAVSRGGSSLRDYVDAESRAGSQQTRHRVYGRSGQRCKRRGCAGVIVSDQIAGRTTAWCPVCQRLDGLHLATKQGVIPKV